MTLGNATFFPWCVASIIECLTDLSNYAFDTCVRTENVVIVIICAHEMPSIILYYSIHNMFYQSSSISAITSAVIPMISTRHTRGVPVCVEYQCWTRRIEHYNYAHTTSSSLFRNKTKSLRFDTLRISCLSCFACCGSSATLIR